MAENTAQVRTHAHTLLNKEIRGEAVESVLVEERVHAVREYYVSFSYDDASRGPVLALSPNGGTGISQAHLAPINLAEDSTEEIFMHALSEAGFLAEDASDMSKILKKLWKLFVDESLLLAEINPLFKTAGGALIAGDAKIILDDEKVRPGERRFIEMDGDIGFLASGGGASMLTLDALLRVGGKPANYTEYSGNPPAEVVKELTKKVLSRPGLKGCFVVGAAANFTDIYTTLSGFLEGLREINPKPAYPIVVRRDGPRKEEAFAMLREAGENEGYDFHLYGSETPMVESAKIMADLAQKYEHLN